MSRWELYLFIYSIYHAAKQNEENLVTIKFSSDGLEWNWNIKITIRLEVLLYRLSNGLKKATKRIISTARNILSKTIVVNRLDFFDRIIIKKECSCCHSSVFYLVKERWFAVDNSVVENLKKILNRIIKKASQFILLNEDAYTI
jgi:hypothetical protein